MNVLTELVYDLTRQHAVLQLSRDNRLSLALGLLDLEESVRKLFATVNDLEIPSPVAIRVARIGDAVEWLITTQGDRSDVDLWMGLLMVSDRALKLLGDLIESPSGATP